MKKLTRKNLDALAAVMPVLSETEQQVCMGGVLYMNSGGTILGYDGGSYDILIADSLPTDYLTNPASSGNFADQNEELKKAVIRKVAYDLGVGKEGGDMECVDIRFSEFSGDESSWEAKADWDVAYPAPDIGVTSFSGTISINTSANLFQQGENYYDYQLALIHEIDHIRTPDYYDATTQPLEKSKDEFSAYAKMLQSENAIRNCSNNFYNSIYSNYVNEYNTLVAEGIIDPSITPLIPRRNTNN